MTKELWTDLDELEYQMGDMNGIAFEVPSLEVKSRQKTSNLDKLERDRIPTKPIRIVRTPEVKKKHIKKDERR